VCSKVFLGPAGSIKALLNELSKCTVEQSSHSVHRLEICRNMAGEAFAKFRNNYSEFLK
jgi:hypothetical protein